MKLETKSVLESLDHYLAERPCHGTLRNLQRAVLSKGKDSLERNGHWPIVDFPLALHEELGGSIPDGLVLGSACALFYAFADITDDAQDHELSPDPWKDWGWEQAVNTGTSLLFQSLQFLYDQLPRERATPIVERFVKAGLDMTYGQHLDLMGLAISGAPLDSYLTMARQKSGASFGAYAASVASMNRQSADVSEAYREFGEILGVMFQMISDVYDLWGTRASQDLQNRRLSYPIALGLEQLGGPHQARLRSLLNGPADIRTQAELIDLLETSGIKTYAKLRIEVYRRRARERAQQLGHLQHSYLFKLIEHPAFPPDPHPDH